MPSGRPFLPNATSGDRLRRLKELEKENERLRPASAIAVVDVARICRTCWRRSPPSRRLPNADSGDGVGALHAECARRGELLTLGRHSADVAALLTAAFDRYGRPGRIVADPWRDAALRDALDRAGVPPAALEFRGMGLRDGAEDVRGVSPGLRRPLRGAGAVAAATLGDG